MKYSELYNFNYLFHKVLGFKNKLLLKVDGRIATAGIIPYRNGEATKLHSNISKMSLKELGYHSSQNEMKRLTNEFSDQYLNKSFYSSGWEKDPCLSLFVLKEFVEKYESKTFDNDQVLYNVKFNESDKTISCYLINEHSELEVIGLLD